MPLSTYSELKTSIANYLGRSDLTSQIPDFISLAEVRLSRDIRTRKMLKTVEATMSVDDATMGLPSDFLSIRDVYIRENPRRKISYMTPAAFSANANADVIGLPIYYTMRSNELEFAPKPDDAYIVQMLYYFRPTAMSDSVPSNLFLENYPDAVLYASLMEAEPYLMNDQRILTWANMYKNAVERIDTMDQESEFSGVPLTMTVTKR